MKLNLSGKHNISAETRFWMRVNKKGPFHKALRSRCWEWVGYLNSGLPALKVKGQMTVAARFCYQLHFGEISDGLLVCHHCDNPLCMNPAHLFLGSPADNMRDKVSKHRQTKGEAVNTAKLRAPQVLEIRKLYAEGRYSQVELALHYGVTQASISAIILRKNWKSI